VTSAEANLPRANVDAFAASIVVLLCLSWGLSQVAMKVASTGIQPVFQAGLRSGIGGLMVVLWCRFRGVALIGRDGTLAPGLVAGFLFGSEFILIYVGFEYTTVSRGILFVYTMPFFVAAGAHFLIPGERLTPLRALGFCAAFAGVVLVFADRESVVSPEAWIGDLLCLIAALFWAATTMTIKTTRLRKVPAEKVLIYQLGVSAFMGLALAPLFGPLIREITPVVVLAFAYQVFPVVAVSYIAWFWILLRYSAGQLSAFTFLTPVFSVLFGALILSEPVTINLAAALCLVALGIYLVNRPRRA
jgi:drug/metabolite transporter (DMT)-like permease